MPDEERPHSADYFGAQRDFWWNQDFFDLMAKRWKLADVRRVLDVGCGAGHWSREILPRCHPQATLIGIDREAEWIAQATVDAKSYSGGRAKFEVGDAMSLDGYGGGFDLVTCQTVLIHLADPARAIAGMVAQLRQGGLLAVAEPNNLANAIPTDSIDADTPMDVLLARFRFHWMCETGKRNLGLGDNSVGDRVPELFTHAGLTNVEVYNSDKVACLAPPYDSPEKIALREEAFEHESRDFAGWDRATAENYFLAGGGDAKSFEEAWVLERARVCKVAAAIRAGHYFANPGGVFYLGVRP